MSGSTRVARPGPYHVQVADVDMTFVSMVGFMVKWAIASIPAMLILLVLVVVVGGFLTGLLGLAG